jgi:hypothetical protein
MEVIGRDLVLSRLRQAQQKLVWSPILWLPITNLSKSWQA